MAGMLKTQHLAQAIGDVGGGEFQRRLSYKAAWNGCRALVASRWGALIEVVPGRWLGG